jgi:hypothetical protein
MTKERNDNEIWMNRPKRYPGKAIYDYEDLIFSQWWL